MIQVSWPSCHSTEKQAIGNLVRSVVDHECLIRESNLRIERTRASSTCKTVIIFKFNLILPCIFALFNVGHAKLSIFNGHHAIIEITVIFDALPSLSVSIYNYMYNNLNLIFDIAEMISPRNAKKEKDEVYQEERKETCIRGVKSQIDCFVYK